MDDKCRLAPKKPPPPPPSDSDNSCAPRLPPKPMREHAKVLFAYEAQHDDELTIKEGDLITVISKEIEDVGWWKGELNGVIGVFPDNFVELIKPTTIPANEELMLPPRLKKPERPPISEKPVNSCVLSKLGVNSSNTANIVDGHPALTAKKPKAPAGPLPPVTKPDVVPQEAEWEWKESTENGISKAKEDKSDQKCVTKNSDVKSSDVESKLKHLTAERVKGPPNRRLPTFKKIDDDECNNEEKHETRNGVKSDEKSKPKTTDTQPKDEDSSIPLLSELQTKLGQRNDDKRSTPFEMSSVRKREPTTKSADARNSLETQFEPGVEQVVNKRHSFNPSMTAELQNKFMSNSTPLLKTPTLVPKPNSLSESSTMANLPQSSPDNSNSVLFKVKQLQASVDDHKEEISELRKELKSLREDCVSRKDFEELKKTVLELRKQLNSESH